MAFDDDFVGRRDRDLRTLGGDFVLKRADGLFAYQFVCAVDDALSGVTEVVRADDLLDSGQRQRWLLEKLSLPVPHYLHVPMMMREDGGRLAKRHGSDDLTALRERGLDVPGVVGYLGWSLGQNNRGERVALPELVERFDWSRVPRVPWVCREEDLVAFAPAR